MAAFPDFEITVIASTKLAALQLELVEAKVERDKAKAETKDWRRENDAILKRNTALMFRLGYLRRDQVMDDIPAYAEQIHNEQVRPGSIHNPASAGFERTDGGLDVKAQMRAKQRTIDDQAVRLARQDVRIGSLHDEIRGVRQEADELREELASVKEEYHQYQQRHASLPKPGISMEDAVLLGLVVRYDAHEKLRGELNASRTQLSASNSANRDLQAGLDALSARLRETEERAIRFGNQVTNLRAQQNVHEAQRATLERTISERNVEISRLNARLAESEAVLAADGTFRLPPGQWTMRTNPDRSLTITKEDR